MKLVTAVLVTWMALIPVSGVSAQTIAIEKTGEIPLDLGDEIVGRIVDVTIDDTGRFFLADEQQHTIWFVERNGKLIRRIGQEGSGPDDLMNPSGTAFMNGTVFVLDAGNARISVFAEEGGILHNFRIDGRAGGIVSDGNRYVAMKNPGDATLVTVYEIDGNEKAKWGDHSGDNWGLPLGRRYITTAPGGQVLTSNPMRYSVLRMDWNGNVLSRYHANPPGFGVFEKPPGNNIMIDLPEVLKTWTPMYRPLAVSGYVLAQWGKISIPDRSRFTTRYFGDLFTMDGEPVQLAIELPMQFYAADGDLLYGIDTAPVDEGADNPYIVVFRLTEEMD
ncbi:MAG: hypothetical protein OXJ55_14320 [Caldilineaceae bacterium]|nr:hypothetical protein [Caldilineaceae bacterium]